MASHLTYLGVDYPCAKAVKGADYIHLLDEDGNVITAFHGVADFSGFSLSGCNWTQPDTCDKSHVAIIRSDGTIDKSNAKYEDFIFADSFYTFPANKTFLATYRELIAASCDGTPASNAMLKPVGLCGESYVSGMPGELSSVEWEGVILRAGADRQRILVWAKDSPIIYGAYANYASTSIAWTKLNLDPAGDTMTGSFAVTTDNGTTHVGLHTSNNWGHVEISASSDHGNKRVLAIGHNVADTDCLVLELWAGDQRVNSYKIYHEANKPTASDLGAGTFPVTDVKAMNGDDYSVARLRNVSFGTTELTDGVSPLADGEMYFMYV